MTRHPHSAASRELTADRTVPALMLKVGKYPVHSGGVAVIRSLGRLGVPVFAVTEPGISPAGASRYCAGRFRWRVAGSDDTAQMVGSLIEMGQRIGRRSVLIPVDDESAVLAAEQAAELSGFFVQPRVPADLPRKLASKSGLHVLCSEHGVPTPRSVVPASAAEVADLAAKATFPVVVKNAGVWDRHGRNPVGASVGGSSSGARMVADADDLIKLVRADNQEPGFVVQEYIPAELAESWFVHLYCDAESNCQVLFTGIKERSWPLRTGVTACGVAIASPDLAAISERFCKAIGYQGIADLDWVRDLRDGQFKLVDFNPRVGNQFRCFQTEHGVDVVRALHLNLTGRAVPPGRQIEGRRIVVEHIDIPARIALRKLRRGEETRSRAPAPTSTELAWFAADDLLPLAAMLTRVRSLTKIIRRGLRAR